MMNEPPCHRITFLADDLLWLLIIFCEKPIAFSSWILRFHQMVSQFSFTSFYVFLHFVPLENTLALAGLIIFSISRNCDYLQLFYDFWTYFFSSFYDINRKLQHINTLTSTRNQTTAAILNVGSEPCEKKFPFPVDYTTLSFAFHHFLKESGSKRVAQTMLCGLNNFTPFSSFFDHASAGPLHYNTALTKPCNRMIRVILWNIEDDVVKEKSQPVRTICFTCQRARFNRTTH